MYRTYKIRLLPTKEQEKLIYKHVGCCRFVWNWGLETQINHYKECGKHYNVFNLMKLLTQLKKQEEYAWLNEVSNHSLQNSCKDLDFAYKRFFKKFQISPNLKVRKMIKYLILLVMTSFILQMSLFRFKNLVK